MLAAVMVEATGILFWWEGAMQRKLHEPNTRLVETVLKSPDPDLVEAKSHTLAHIIKSARMIIVAPLVAGAYQVPTLISTGQYMGAIKCASVSSATFLILATSLWLADLVVNRIEQRRG